MTEIDPLLSFYNGFYFMISLYCIQTIDEDGMEIN